MIYPFVPVNCYLKDNPTEDVGASRISGQGPARVLKLPDILREQILAEQDRVNQNTISRQ